MSTDPIDAEFLRFQRTRSPDALAAVFDAVAPRLLLVAMHLCGDAATAEDLVQTVFLQAMRDADRFDRTRPVLPWLLAILEHRARDLGRRTVRRRESPALPSEPADSSASDPVQAAARAELHEQVARALSGVPPDYRELLALRLVHGLRAIDIAHLKSLPPATVRTRLRRGLDLLRRSLPRGISAPLLTAWLATEAVRAGDGMPAVREHVLRTLTAGSASVATGATVTKWLLGAAVLVAALLTTLRLRPADAPPPPRSEQPPAAIVASTGNAASLPIPADRDLVGVGRDGDTRLGPRASATTTLHGRIVHGSGGVAAAGTALPACTVTLQAYSESEPDALPAAWQDPRVVTTAADGRFAFEFEPPPSLGFSLEFRAAGHVERRRSFASLRTGIDADLGDVVLEPGTPVRIRITVDGRPRAGLAVAVGQLPTQDQRIYEPSDRDGMVDVGVCGLGRWQVDVQTELHGNLAEFDVPWQRDPFVVDVSLRQPPAECSVSGVIVDQFERPVADLEVQVPVPGSYMHGMWTATTDGDGRFLLSLRRPWEGKDLFSFQLPQARTDLAWIDDGGSFAWGTHDHRLVVRRCQPGSLQVSVVDARTGAAVESFGAECRTDHWQLGNGSGFARRTVAASPHADGTLAFEALPPGPHLVSVFPVAPYAERWQLPVLVPEGTIARLRVEVMPPVELRVVVHDQATGQPVEGVDVILGRVMPSSRLDEVGPRTYRIDVEDVRRGRAFGTARPHVLVLDRCISDRQGIASLHGPHDTSALVVLVEGARCVPHCVRGIELPATGATLRVAVEAAAELTGVVQPVAFVQAFGPDPEDVTAAEHDWELPDPRRFDDDYPEVQLEHCSDASIRVRSRITADGHFAFASLRPGRYRASLVVRLRIRPSLFTKHQLPPSATVDVVAGEARAVVLDATPHLPGRITARFFVDGAPWQGRAGFVHEGGRRHIFLTDASGDMRTPWLPPGVYLPLASVPGPNDTTGYVLGTERVIVTPGIEVSCTPALQHRAVTVHLVGDETRPLGGRRVVLEPVDATPLAFAWRYGARTDAEGRVTFAPAPPGRLVLRAFADDQDPMRDGERPGVLLGELAPEQDAATLPWPR